MPSTDTKPELTAKALMAQPVSQPAVYANGGRVLKTYTLPMFKMIMKHMWHVYLPKPIGTVCHPLKNKTRHYACWERHGPTFLTEISILSHLLKVFEASHINCD
jgi:hypothetical protein